MAAGQRDERTCVRGVSLHGERTGLHSECDRVSGQPRKIAVYVFGLRPNDFTFQTSPRTKLLGTLESPGFTTLVLQLDDAAGASALDVTIQKKGAPTSQKSSVALVRQ